MRFLFIIMMLLLSACSSKTPQYQNGYEKQKTEAQKAWRELN